MDQDPVPAPVPGPIARDPFDDAFHKTIVDNIVDGVYYVDRGRKVTYWNHGAERLTGYSAADMVGRHCFANRLSHVDAAGTALCNDGCPLSATIADGETREVEVWLRHQDGHRRPVRVRTAPVHDSSGAIIGAVEVFDDASRMIEAREQVEIARRDALTDALTGLPNRRRFDADLAGRLDNLGRYGWLFGLLIADIDHFKLVNDDHGHDVGDAALRVVGASILGGVRGGDLAARWGGEEFAVLLQDADAAAMRATGERVRNLVARSVVRDGAAEFSVRISVGGAVARPEDDVASLLARADEALYRAKDAGRDRMVLAEDPRFDG